MGRREAWKEMRRGTVDQGPLYPVHLSLSVMRELEEKDGGIRYTPLMDKEGWEHVSRRWAGRQDETI